MKLLKSSICFALAAVIFVGLFAGCGEKKEVINTGERQDTWITDTPLELTIHYSHSSGGPFQDDYSVFQEAARRTNIILKGTVPQSNTEHDQSFNTMIASGELADIIATKKTNFEKYAEAGAFVELDDLIDQYAPNIKQFLDNNPDVKRNAQSADGKLYFIPNVPDGEAAAGWFIRKDWLDKLNLEIPQTVEEYHDALLAFKNGDPNGNGVADEIPFFDRGKTIKSILALYGIRDGWSVADNGEVVYGKYIPEYKEGLKQAAQWYKEGLIDAEIFTRGSNAREQLFEENVGGSLHDWFTSTTVFNDRMKESVPDFNLIAIEPPADINGERWEDTSRATVDVYGWGISSTNSHPVETIKYFDFWFSEEGRLLYNFGIEGEQYDMVDGKPVFKDEFINCGKTMTDACWENGMQLMIGAPQDIEYERQWMNEDSQAAIDMYTNGGYIKDAFPVLAFTADEQKVITEKWSSIYSSMVEYEQKCVLGNLDVEETFDSHMNDLKNMGMEDVLKVYNDAYQRYLSN